MNQNPSPAKLNAPPPPEKAKDITLTTPRMRAERAQQEAIREDMKPRSTSSVPPWANHLATA